MPRPCSFLLCAKTHFPHCRIMSYGADQFMLSFFLKVLSWDCSKSRLDCTALAPNHSTLKMLRIIRWINHSLSVHWNLARCMDRLTKGLIGSWPSKSYSSPQNFKFCSLSLLSSYCTKQVMVWFKPCFNISQLLFHGLPVLQDCE